MYRSPTVNKLKPLLGGTAFGYFTLPEIVLDLSTASTRLRDAQNELVAPEIRKAQLALQQEFIDAALTGQPWPDGSKVVKLDVAQRRYEEQLRALSWAREDTDQRLEEAVNFQRETILAEHLRPALEALLAELQPLAVTFVPFVAVSDADLLNKGEDVRHAAQELTRLATAYSHIRAAQYLLDPPNTDAARWLSDYRNLKDLFGNRWDGYHLDPWRPWPRESTRAFMVWLGGAMDPAPEVWLPTSKEWTERYNVYFGASHARLIASRSKGGWGSTRTTPAKPTGPAPTGTRAQRFTERLATATTSGDDAA